jgi:hypothetical protein
MWPLWQNSRVGVGWGAMAFSKKCLLVTLGVNYTQHNNRIRCKVLLCQVARFIYHYAERRGAMMGSSYAIIFEVFKKLTFKSTFFSPNYFSF